LITKNVLSWDIILEIAEYLSLNDAVNAFSTNILSLLRKNKMKVHISEPSDKFMSMVLQKLDPEQIVSLRFDTNGFGLKLELAALQNITSLTLLNLQFMEYISECAIHFPKLTRLLLWYDNEVGFNFLSSMFRHLQSPIERLEIRCAGALCTHYDTKELYLPQMGNVSINYFLLDVRHLPVTSTNECFRQYESCFLMTIIDLIKSMRNIRHVCFIVNKYNLEKLLHVNEWISLLYASSELKKVTLCVLGSVLEDEQVNTKLLEIQNKFYNMRRIIKFQVISK
jgi:hypothetical protein